MFFYCLFLALINNGSHDVGEYAKLVEVSQLNAYVKSLLHLHLVHFENEGDALEAVSEELGQIIEEVLVDKSQILDEIGSELIQVEEYLLEVFFNEGQDAYEFNVAESGDNIVGNTMVLISNQQRKLDIQPLHELLSLSLLLLA